MAAIETDTGGARVVGLGIDLADDRDESAFIQTLEPVMESLRALGAERVSTGHAGADSGRLIARGVPGIGLIHDVSHYFDVHHTRADTLDKISPDALQQGVAATATLFCALAEMPPSPHPEPLARRSSERSTRSQGHRDR